MPNGLSWLHYSVAIKAGLYHKVVRGRCLYVTQLPCSVKNLDTYKVVKVCFIPNPSDSCIMKMPP